MIRKNQNSKKCGISPYGCPRKIFITEPSGIVSAENIFTAARKIIEEYPCVEIVCPEFRNSRLFKIAEDILEERVIIVSWEDGETLKAYIDESYMVVSDDPSVCSYASLIGKPALITLRSQWGNLPLSARLVGTLQEPVYRAMRELLVNSALYYAMGHAGVRSAELSGF